MKQLLAVLVFIFPIAAFADLSQTTTLPSGSAINLDTGAVASSGGDLLWNGTTLTPQGTAKAANIPASNGGAAFFAALPSTIFTSIKILASSAPLGAATIVPGDVFVVFTNGGNNTKVLVVSNSGGSITLQFTTYVVAGPPAGPIITAVLNNSSQIPAGLPNSGIAPSSIFIVQGTGLADPGTPTLQSSAAPGIPSTLNGASISVKVGSVTVQPALYYTSPTQLAAVLPASTPVGAATLTVTYKGTTSAAAAFQVVPAALGINFYNANTGVATDSATGALLTYGSSGSPGEIIVLWTTGLGADPSDSDMVYSSAPHAVSTPLQIYIGGVPATILYQGSAGYPGVDQIDLTIPQSAPSGCWVSLVAVAGGVPSNTASLPINPGGGPCIDPVSGLNGNQIAPGGGGQTLRTGVVEVLQGNSPGTGTARIISNSADAAFEKYTGIYTPNSPVSPGGCLANYLMPATVGSITGLDAGTITLTGPGGLSVTLANQLGIKGAFYTMLTSGELPQSGGTFTFMGSGGADVGPFTSTVTFANPLLTWTNQNVAATVDRSQNLTVTWTGGNPGTYVILGGVSTQISPRVTGSYTCVARVDAGQFTIPSYILSSLPAGAGGMSMQNNVQSSLSASGLDIGVAGGDVSFSVKSTFK